MRTQGGRRVVGTAGKARALMREVFPRKKAAPAPPAPGDFEEFLCACDWFASEDGGVLDIREFNSRRRRRPT